MSLYLSEYLPIIFFILIGLGFGFAMTTMSFLIEKPKPDNEKLSSYECGFEAFDDARGRFDVRFYLVAILFIIFGAASTFIGQVLLQNSYELRIAAGLIIIILSLHIIGIINLKFLNYEKRIQTNNNRNIFSPIIIGMAFAFGWTPCIGPILGSILVFAATEESLNKGVLLLFFYSLGLAIPFILSGYLIQKFLIFSKNFKKNINLVSKIGGIILLITGILILTNQLQTLGFNLLNILPFLQNFG